MINPNRLIKPLAFIAVATLGNLACGNSQRNEHGECADFAVLCSSEQIRYLNGVEPFYGTSVYYAYSETDTYDAGLDLIEDYQSERTDLINCQPKNEAALSGVTEENFSKDGLLLTLNSVVVEGIACDIPKEGVTSVAEATDLEKCIFIIEHDLSGTLDLSEDEAEDTLWLTIQDSSLTPENIECW